MLVCGLAWLAHMVPDKRQRAGSYCSCTGLQVVHGRAACDCDVQLCPANSSKGCSEGARVIQGCRNSRSDCAPGTGTGIAWRPVYMPSALQLLKLSLQWHVPVQAVIQYGASW